jgi:hypothetical protein
VLFLPFYVLLLAPALHPPLLFVSLCSPSFASPPSQCSRLH